MKAAYKSVITIVVVSLALFGVLAPVNTAEAALYPAARIIVLSEDSDVTVTFLPSEAGANNQFGLWSPDTRILGWAHDVPVGTVFNLGRFPAGTELVFFIYHPVADPLADYWLNGPAERNADNTVHAVITDVGFQAWEVGFEDLGYGGDRDFNDVRFIVSGDLYIAPPLAAITRIEPETLNLASKGVFTAFINLPEGYNVTDIDISTVVCEGAPAVQGMVSEQGGGTYIAKFKIQDLVDVLTGDVVTLRVTGRVRHNDGSVGFEGNDTIRVINPVQGKK